MRTDRDGQPPAQLNRGQRATRTIAEMLGLAKGLIADGYVNELEAAYLARWLDANPDAWDQWPCNVVGDRLKRIFADGVCTESERGELLDLLGAVTGGGIDPESGANTATTLPLNDPVPTIEYDGQTFVFTGKFIYGTRADCTRAIESQGGVPGKGVTQETNYLVIGDLGSRDWVQSSFGRKIQKAVRYRDELGVSLVILHEQDWAVSLGE